MVLTDMVLTFALAVAIMFQAAGWIKRIKEQTPFLYTRISEVVSINSASIA